MFPRFHITQDSRQVRPGSIFFALKGEKIDGHDFIDAALKSGAKQVFSEHAFDDQRVTVLGPECRKKLGLMASEAYDHPSHQLKMIGITGTSGKTTTSYLVQHLLNSTGHACARIGTNGFNFAGLDDDTQNTTPDPVTLHAYLAAVLQQGGTHVVMEVSSHGLTQERVWGIAWDAVGFLNLGREHLDYHLNMDEYYSAKRNLFFEHVEFSKQCGKKVTPIVSIASNWGQKLNSELSNAIRCDSKQDLQSTLATVTGLSGNITLNHKKWHPFSCPLIGAFQLENILVALQLATACVSDKINSIEHLATFQGVPGRMERIENNHNITVIVDYAHKPEALEHVLTALRAQLGSEHCLHLVFGCGGNRDPHKRKLMGSIAGKFCHSSIITNDNPRFEDPVTIAQMIAAGMPDKANYQINLDRKLAIHTVLSQAKTGDIVVIAGKGHETYQINGTQKIHFDDREVVRDFFNQKS